jgi:hypothetical protein
VSPIHVFHLHDPRGDDSRHARSSHDAAAIRIGLGLEGALIGLVALVGIRAIGPAGGQLFRLVTGHLTPNVLQFASIGGLLFLMAVVAVWAAAVLWQIRGRRAGLGRTARGALWTGLGLSLSGAGVILAGGFDRYAPPGLVALGMAMGGLLVGFAAGILWMIRRTRAATA